MRTVTICTLLLALACGKEDPPPYSHDEPDEANAQTCVLCHSCGTDGINTEQAPSPGQKHAVCKDCHATDPAKHEPGPIGSDWQKSCDDPPFANCSQCHVNNEPDKTITQVNDACRDCHDKE